MKPILRLALAAAAIAGLLLLASQSRSQPAPPPQPPTYTITLTPPQVDLLGQAIDELPGSSRRPLIAAIAGQIQAQQAEYVKSHPMPTPLPPEKPADEPKAK